MRGTAIEATCHCGQVRLEIGAELNEVTDCNCSICRRYGALWAYFTPRQVRVIAPAGATETYMWGDRMIRFHRCKSCGCITHWTAVDETVPRMGVNARLMAPEIVAKARVRRIDGADTWKELG